MYLSNTDIDYIAIEAIPKSCVRDNVSVSDCGKEIVYGVLAGIRQDQYAGVSTNFILIHDMKKDARFSLNAGIYNIVSLDRCVGTGKRYFTFYTSSDDDQKAALKHVDNIIDTLNSQSKCFAERREVDISKYINMPYIISSGDDTDKEKTKTTVKPQTNNSIKLGFDCRTTNTYTPPSGPAALFFRRKTDKPDLKQMRGLVRKVMANKYEDPEIEEIEVKEAVTTKRGPCAHSNFNSYDDDYSNGMYGY